MFSMFASRMPQSGLVTMKQRMALPGLPNCGCGAGSSTSPSSADGYGHQDTHIRGQHGQPGRSSAPAAAPLFSPTRTALIVSFVLSLTIWIITEQGSPWESLSMRSGVVVRYEPTSEVVAVPSTIEPSVSSPPSSALLPLPPSSEERDNTEARGKNSDDTDPLVGPLCRTAVDLGVGVWGEINLSDEDHELAVPIPGDKRRPIPFLGTNVDYDLFGYTQRLMSTLDYPVRTLAVAHGGCEDSVLRQLRALQGSRQQGNLTLSRLEMYLHPRPLGCAPGWNALLDRMMSESSSPSSSSSSSSQHEAAPWALIVNNDVMFPPGTLAKIAEAVWKSVETTGDRFCMAFVSSSHFDKWSAYIITRRFIEMAGRFDENLYPAYFEDAEMGYRHGRLIRTGQCEGPHEYDIPYVHGEPDNVHDENYKSGSKQTLARMKSSEDDVTRERAEQWKAKLERGVKAATRYLNFKWGCNDWWNKEWIIYACKYQRPFNESLQLPLSHWALDEDRRKCLDTGEGVTTEDWCPFDPARVTAGEVMALAPRPETGS